MEGSQIVLPEKGDVMTFEIYNNKCRHPFTIYSDFECGNKSTDDDKKRVHVPNSYGFSVCSEIGAFPSKYYEYVGEDAIYQYVK